MSKKNEKHEEHKSKKKQPLENAPAELSAATDNINQSEHDHTNSSGESIDHEKQLMDEKNVAGQSNTHKESMSGKHGDEKRAEEGFNKLTESLSHSPGTTTEGPTKEKKEIVTDDNKAGESKSKVEREKETEKPH